MRTREAKVIKAIVGLAVLLILALVVSGYFSEYREANGGGEDASQAETTPTTPPAEQGGEQPEGEQTPSAVPASGKKDMVVVLIDGLNLRKEARTDSPTLGGLDEGDKLTLIGQTEGWYEVQTADGSRGWVSANPAYVRIEE